MGSATIHLPLNPLDHSPPPNYTCSTCYLPLKPDVNPDEAFRVLREGLHKTFVQLPWLSGKIWPQSSDTPGWRPGQLEIRYKSVDIAGQPPYQLKFKQLPSSVTYDDLKESAFPTDVFEDHDVIWAPYMPDVTKGCEVFVSQASFLPGGCLLTSALHHNAGDGLSTFYVVNLWADHCKALQSQSTQPPAPAPERSDHSLLERIWAKEGKGKPASEIDPNVWRLHGLDPAHLQPDEPISNGDKALHASSQAAKVNGHQQPIKSAIFYISPSNFSALQKESVRVLKAAAHVVSGTHAICALVWRCLEKARYTAAASPEVTGQPAAGTDDNARMDILLDGRAGFSESLPSTHLGNHTVHVRSTMALQTLTSPDTKIAPIAGLISENASRLDSATLMEAFTLLKTMPDYEWLSQQKWQGRLSISRVALMITSMLMVPHDQLNFGDGFFGNMGKPDSSRPLMGGLNRSGTRICFVLPRTANGGVEFIVNLSEEEMSLLEEDEEFERYAMLLAR
ncbi:MAG: hypothetical protein Q9217_006577 [Psora testacea]